MARNKHKKSQIKRGHPDFRDPARPGISLGQLQKAIKSEEAALERPLSKKERARVISVISHRTCGSDTHMCGDSRLPRPTRQRQGKVSARKRNDNPQIPHWAKLPSEVAFDAKASLKS